MCCHIKPLHTLRSHQFLASELTLICTNSNVMDLSLTIRLIISLNLEKVFQNSRLNYTEDSRNAIRLEKH